MVIITVVLARIITAASRCLQQQVVYARAVHLAEEIFASITTVAAFGQQRQEARRYDAELTGVMKIGNRKVVI